LQGRVVGAALCALILSACASAPSTHLPPGPPASHRPPSPFPAEPRPPESRTLPLAALRGWTSDDHAAALAAFQQTCGAARDAELARICRNARAIGPLGGDAARRFFEANFVAERSAGEGVLTA
jgi:membrane-bound lytic murein transglycosylase A